jgi:hypothetical protein
MRNRFVAWTVAILAILSLWALWRVKLARTVDPSGTAKAQAAAPIPDLSGVWYVRKFTPKMYQDGDPPLQPWAKAKFKTANPETNDPRLNCLPHGMPMFMYSRQPMEFFQIPGRVVVHVEDDGVLRQIYTDGRQHPKDPDPTYNGHSIGRWEGDTLIVDTIGLKDTTWTDHVGLPHSDALHVVERIRRVDHNTLVDDFAIDDPKTFTKTWTAQQIYDLKPDWEVQENVCEENNKYRSRSPASP